MNLFEILKLIVSTDSSCIDCRIYVKNDMKHILFLEKSSYPGPPAGYATD